MISMSGIYCGRVLPTEVTPALAGSARTGIDEMTSLKTARQIKTAAEVEIDIEALKHLAYVAAAG